MTTPNGGKADRKRLSIQLGPALTQLLAEGNCPGNSIAARLDTLAQRYLALANAAPTWSPESWTHAIATARRIDLTHPAAPYTLGGLIRQERADSKLVYAFESITTAGAFAVIAIAERFIATGRDITPEEVAQFLEKSGVATQRA